MLAVILGGWIIMYCVDSFHQYACGNTQDAYSAGYYKGWGDGHSISENAQNWGIYVKGMEMGQKIKDCPNNTSLTDMCRFCVMRACDDLANGYSLRDLTTNETLCNLTLIKGGEAG